MPGFRCLVENCPRQQKVITANTMEKQYHVTGSRRAEWIPLSRSLFLIFTRKRLLGWSAVLVLLTIALTWLGFVLTVDFMDGFTGSFFSAAPADDTIWGWIKYRGWLAGKWLFLFVSRIVAFYFAFLVAYCMTTPGYVFLSSAAEKLHAGEYFDEEAGFTLPGFFRDILEGVKIAMLGVLVTISAIFLNFLPAVGQAAVFMLYVYYSALMFLDFPASRRRWSLGEKIGWLRTHSGPGFRLGIMPALISMVPVVNIFAMALLFPLLTVHTTLNFYAIEAAGENRSFKR